jgi:hypothetical protein
MLYDTTVHCPKLGILYSIHVSSLSARATGQLTNLTAHGVVEILYTIVEEDSSKIPGAKRHVEILSIYLCALVQYCTDCTVLPQSRTVLYCMDSI